MKLLNLHMKNIGPYLDQTIDFTQLEDMFLITGKTGSGKTTIFDAVTYALYGSLPGKRDVTGEAHIHSDFAKEEDEAFVDLTFSIGEQKYRVQRKVPGVRITRTGNRTKSTGEVDLSAWDGSVWKNWEGKSLEINRKIQDDIIGLTVDEFKQIVLLPQGEFAEFLSQTPMQRKETLSKLFPVSFYTRLCQKTEDLAKEAKLEMSRVQKNLEEALRNFDGEEREARLLQIEKEMSALQKSTEEFSPKIQEFVKKHTEAEQKKELAREALKLAQEKNLLETKKEQMKVLEKKLSKAQEAMFLTEKIGTKKSLLERIDQQKKDLQSLEENLAKEKEKAEELKKSAEEMKEAAQRKADLDIQIHDSDAAMEKLSLIEEASKKFENQKENVIQLYMQTYPAAQKAEQSLLQCEEDIKSNIQLAEKTRTSIESLTEQKASHERNELSVTLALTLKDGEACPVCGSKTHPCIAVSHATEISFDEEIQIQTAAKKALELDREALYGKKENLQVSCHMLSSTISELEETAKRYGIVLPQKENIPPREKEIPSRNNIEKQRQCISEAQKLLYETQGKVDALKGERTLDRKSLEKQKQNLCMERKSLEEKTEAYEKQVQKNMQNITSLSAECDSVKNSMEQNSLLMEKTKKEIETLLLQTAFKSEEEVLSSAMEKSHYDESQKELKNFTESYRTVCARLEANKTDPTLLESYEKECMELKKNLSALQTEHEQAQKEISRLREEKQTVEIERNRIQALEEQGKKLGKENEALIRLDDDINGRKNNPKKIALDSWVLGTFLEDVLLAANLRFETISSGRYRFNLQTEKKGGHGEKGLDITVTDTYTGLERSPLSLSGGEKFMASLSLALALTDVVQAQSGGITLDSLFIDEGFGSLDEEVLSNAVSVLESIRENKTVGIISHIASLNDPIKNILHVEKTESGSTVSIIKK